MGTKVNIILKQKTFFDFFEEKMKRRHRL